MFHTPDYYRNVSMRLSEVLDEIGVNENMVMKRRGTTLLKGTIQTIELRSRGRQSTVYELGSRSEGTTTAGLESDIDTLYCIDWFNVIQDWCEWTAGKANLLMVQNETTPPGYCLLHALRGDVPLPMSDEIPLPMSDRIGNNLVKDTSGRILFKNTILDDCLPEGCQRHGPCRTIVAQPGFVSMDLVIAYPCKSCPQLARAWLDQQETNTWPTPEMKRYMKSTKCFVVCVGSKGSENADFEWRISTSLAEQCLMFNLNITQIRCYILMKMILKTYINFHNESYVSSYMCKTVLFHCIASKPSYIWKECNIINCLNFCIFTLNRCILNGNCPHFIYHGNNLMAGQFSAEAKHKILNRMSNLIPCDGISLFGVQIDDLGQRFQLKLNMINNLYINFLHPDVICTITAAVLSCNTARDISNNYNKLIHWTKDQDLKKRLKNLIQIVQHLIRYYRDGNMLEKTACRLLASLLCTSIGSLIASNNIQMNREVSPPILAWLEAGLDSDVASSRLKLASIMYCSGDMERADFILFNTGEQYRIEITESFCGCYPFRISYIKREFRQLCIQYDEVALKYIVAFCVKFCSSEIHCVPHELRYEMFRSTQDDLQHRGIHDDWMDWAVVGSLPYLYFLQYKTYGSLQRLEEQQHALHKLVSVIETEPNLGHRETALNLLGQCMEQENRISDALKCYMLSLGLRERNNAARIHICRCLANANSLRLHRLN